MMLPTAGAGQGQETTGSPRRVEWAAPDARGGSDGQRYSALLFTPEHGRAAATVLLRLPVAPQAVQQLASARATAGLNVVLQETQAPIDADGGRWRDAQVEATRSALAWIREQAFSTDAVALLAVGPAAASLHGGSALPPLRAAAFVDPQTSLAEAFCDNGLPRLAEHVALRAARAPHAEPTAAVVVDWTTCQAEVPLLEPATLGSSGLPTLWLSGWHRSQLTGTLSAWRRLRESAGGRPAHAALQLGTWGQETDALASMLTAAFAWLGERLGTGEGEESRGEVRFAHLEPGSSANARAREHMLTSSEWPPACDGCTHQTWYLQAGGAFSAAPPGPNAPTSYRYDPGDPVFSIGGSAWNLENLLQPRSRERYAFEPLETGPLDQRRIPERRDYLRFRSRPLEEPLVVRGDVAMELWVATDAPRTAFVVKLVHSYPDGYQALLREVGLATGPMRYGIPAKLRVDLGPIARTIPVGHRLAIHITSSSWPRYARHPNSDVLAGRVEPKPTHQSIYHDRARPSAVLLPVVPSALAAPDSQR